LGTALTARCVTDLSWPTNGFKFRRDFIPRWRNLFYTKGLDSYCKH